jgi:hypothetical protein
VNVLAWAVSPRYRRLLIARRARAERNTARAVRHREQLRRVVWDAYVNATSYREARRLAGLIAAYRL